MVSFYREKDRADSCCSTENMKKPIDLLLHGIVEYVQYLNFAGTLTLGFKILTE